MKKKIMLATVVAVLVVLMVVMLAGCTDVKQIDRVVELYKSAKSYSIETILLTKSILGENKVRSYCEVAGKLMYMESMGVKTYSELVGDKRYDYIYNSSSDKYVKSNGAATTDTDFMSINSSVITDTIKSENFEYSKTEKAFVYKHKISDKVGNIIVNVTPNSIKITIINEALGSSVVSITNITYINTTVIKIPAAA